MHIYNCIIFTNNQYYNKMGDIEYVKKYDYFKLENNINCNETLDKLTKLNSSKVIREIIIAIISISTFASIFTFMCLNYLKGCTNTEDLVVNIVFSAIISIVITLIVIVMLSILLINMNEDIKELKYDYQISKFIETSPTIHLEVERISDTSDSGEHYIFRLVNIYNDNHVEKLRIKYATMKLVTNIAVPEVKLASDEYLITIPYDKLTV